MSSEDESDFDFIASQLQPQATPGPGRTRNMESSCGVSSLSSRYISIPPKIFKGHILVEHDFHCDPSSDVEILSLEGMLFKTSEWRLCQSRYVSGDLPRIFPSPFHTWSEGYNYIQLTEHSFAALPLQTCSTA